MTCTIPKTPINPPAAIQTVEQLDDEGSGQYGTGSQPRVFGMEMESRRRCTASQRNPCSDAM